MFEIGMHVRNEESNLQERLTRILVLGRFIAFRNCHKYIIICSIVTVRCAKEHPHHTLPILFSLKNSEKDKCILNASASAAAGTSGRPHEPRVLAAETLVRQLAEAGDSLRVIIAQMEKMCDGMCQ